MKYEFSIEWNVHMYNHIITSTYGNEKYKTICESAPLEKNTILFWPDDFGLSLNRTEDLIIDLEEWAEKQDFEYKIILGKGR